MSRFIDTVRRAQINRLLPTSERTPLDGKGGPRPFRVLTVTSNKGGVGKTTVATNLAIYLRALREDLPILILGFDDQGMIDRMFKLDSESPCETMTSAVRAGSLESAIRLGQFGVQYVPSAPDIAELKREISDPFHLQTILRRTDWHGLIIIDTKSDLEILSQNAIAASDLAVVVVADRTSLNEAEKVFGLLDTWTRPREHARILLTLVDRRIKYRESSTGDVLALLISEIRSHGYPLFESFLSRSPKIESLHTNPDGRVLSILHGARDTLVYRQMRHLAADVLTALDQLAPDAGDPPPSPDSTEGEGSSARGPMPSFWIHAGRSG